MTFKLQATPADDGHLMLLMDNDTAKWLMEFMRERASKLTELAQFRHKDKRSAEFYSQQAGYCRTVAITIDAALRTGFEIKGEGT